MYMLVISIKARMMLSEIENIDVVLKSARRLVFMVEHRDNKSTND